MGFRNSNKGNYYHDYTWQENTTFKALAGKPDLQNTALRLESLTYRIQQSGSKA